VGLALVSAVLLIRYRVNSAWLVVGGAVVGLLVGLSQELMTWRHSHAPAGRFPK
jgi:type III secretory pathway component EscS